MNLYIFNEPRLGAVYGVGTYVRELAIALKGSCANVCVMNLNSEKPQIDFKTVEGVQHLYFPSPIKWSKDLQEHWDLYHRNIVYWLLLHIKDEEELIFHLNYNQKSGLARELKKEFNCKVILTVHYLDQVKEMILVEKEIFEVVDYIICLSNKTYQLLQVDYKINSDKISKIDNGLTDADSAVEKSGLRRKFNLPSNASIILFVGRLDRMKGLSYALQAFKKVLGRRPDCRFIIVGNGDFKHHMAECEDIWMNVVWTGFINKEKLYELYAIADIGILPSFHEQCSYVAIEMMMHGLPVIGTSTGLDEMVENDITGLHVRVIEQTDRMEIDSSLLAEKILYLLESPAEAKRMGQNGRRRYLNNYSSDIFRENMLKIYESCWHRDDGKIKVLIVTGQSNHNWEVSHLAIKQILENSGLFTVNVAISPETGKIMSNFTPDFASYQLVVLDYNGDRWSEETEKAFLSYVENGGGVVVYHAANNAFRDWKEYNRIIGFGGWEGRDETAGPYIYMKEGCPVYDEKTSGCAGSHGIRHEFVLHCGNPDHPVTKGLPAAWRHAQDELYDRMRGQGIVKDVLFWGYSDPATKGSGRDEISLFTVDYGKARIFHTTLGHAGNSLDNNTAMQCAGFQVTLLRGAEWAATGQVTQPVPDDFPTETTVSLRKNYK